MTKNCPEISEVCGYPPQLCPKLARLENSAQACFSYQLKRCKGACIGKESSEHYNVRVQEALGDYQEES